MGEWIEFGGWRRDMVWDWDGLLRGLGVGGLVWMGERMGLGGGC